MDTGACLGCLEELEPQREGLGTAGIPGGNWEWLPTLPACISFWNSYKFWNNIPQNNNRKGRKKKTKTKKKPTQPTLPKEKKFPKSFALESLGTSGRPKIRGMRKNQGGFCVSVTARFGNYQRFQSLIPTRIQGKKWEFPAATPTSQPRFGRQPIPKGENQTKLNQNRGFALLLLPLLLLLLLGIVGVLGTSGCAACFPGWRRSRDKEQP